MKLSTVILAAGLGTRMKSSIPKVLHRIYDKPLIQHVVDAVIKLKAEENIVVVGKDSEGIKAALPDYPLTFVIQKEPKGTADALKAAVKKLKVSPDDMESVTLVLNGDTPLIDVSILKGLLKLHRGNKEDISIVSFLAEGSHSYGRILRKGKKVEAIIEDRDADEEQKRIKEVNSGIYALKSEMLKLLDEIKINGKKGEYYLTDIIRLAVKKGYKVGAHMLGSEMELTGINTREELYNAAQYLKDKILSHWLDNGVSLLDRISIFIHPDVQIGMDTVIYPNVHIEGKTVIGARCIIYPNTRIVSSIIGNDVIIKDTTVIDSSTVKDKASVGPFAHIRPGSLIGSSAKIGNFVEVKKSIIGDGVKASHLSYLGDAEIGKNVNIGAGTITCNYDGRTKHKTIIEDDVFIGSDTQLVAPVRVGHGAYVGAGSTITNDVPPLSLAISRARQRNVKGWARKKLKVKKEEKT